MKKTFSKWLILFTYWLLSLIIIGNKLYMCVCVCVCALSKLIYIYFFDKDDFSINKKIIHQYAEELMLLNCGIGEDSWESLGLQGCPNSPSWGRSVLGIHWKDWCWCWNSSTLTPWCKKVTHLKTPWCWEGLGAGREGDDRGWNGWMASPTWWTWVWVNSGSWWWTGRPGMLWFMGSPRVGQNRATEMNWTELQFIKM